MKEPSTSRFVPDLYLSEKPVIAIVFCMALVFYVSAEGAGNDLMLWDTLMNGALLACVLTAAPWLLSLWRPAVGKWATVVALVILIEFARFGLNMTGAQVLLAIPVTLAVTMLGVLAGLIVASGGTTLLVAVAWISPGQFANQDVTITLVVMWVVLAAMLGMHRRVQALGTWSLSHLHKGQRLVKEAHDKGGQLRKTIADLEDANRRLALFNRKVAALQHMAEEAERTKSAFLAKVSHEFRTPLNIILGLVGLMGESPRIYGEQLPEKLSEHLQIVYRNCVHLSTMIDDVLDLSMAEAGKMSLRRENTQLWQVIERAVSSVRPLVEKKGLSLQIEIADDIPKVFCDRTRVFQVVVNLVSNAARFTEKGGITARARIEANKVIVSVTDTGSGIPKEDLESIFEPFCQGGDRMWRAKRGSGLGLAISKQFVEMHGGHLWVDSEPGKGSSFHFSLPLVSRESSVSPARWISPDWVDRSSQTHVDPVQLQQRMVVCDETGEVQALLSRYSDDVEYAPAATLAEVKQDLERCPAQAVVLNCTSVERLWHVVEATRQEISDTPIIGCVVSGADARVRDLGAVRYLTKPLTRRKLLEAIRELGKPVKTVLVVDDGPDERELMAHLLAANGSGCEVVMAADGEQALKKMRSHQPDVVLLDLVIPEPNGWQVLAEKNGDETIRDIPVIIVSGQDPRERPVASDMVMATVGSGISVGRLVRCIHQLGALLMEPD